MYSNGKTTPQLFAVVDRNTREVRYTRGGSSTSAKLMVYPTEAKAKAAIKSAWTAQVFKETDVDIVMVYDCWKPKP